jgi:ATP-dependent protease ClpP protease subunit
MELKDSLNYIKDKRVYIFGEFDDSINQFIIPDLIALGLEKQKEATLEIYIDSNGGYTHVLKTLLGHIEALKHNGVIVKTYAYARAYSCASILACSGTNGHRYISEETEHLCHLGFATTGWVQNDIELQRRSDYVQRHFDFIRKMYKKYANIKNLDEVIKNDHLYLDAKKIIEYKLADKIIGKDK